jgi:glycolate oxidase FAD binding subunit
MDHALQEATDRIRQAAAQGTPLRIRGGGTKDFYGQTLQGDVLDTTALSGIVSYEPSELVVTARAGTPLSVLEAALAEEGQYLPFEPPHFGAGATVGGMVAAGLSGPARATAGSVRDFVLGVAMLNGKAEHLRFGGQVMKNVAGYDVSRLMAGALGTLGLLTEISLKVLPVAPAQATLRFELDEAAAIRRLNEWAGQPLPLNASAWMMDAGRPVLQLRLRGAVAAVEAACVRLLAQVAGARTDAPGGPPESAADWAAGRELSLPWFAAGHARAQDLWRLGVPPTAEPLNLGDSRIEWLGGQRWLWADPHDAAAPQRIRAGAAAVGGHATLFRRAGALSEAQARAVPRFDALAPPLDRLHRQLKHEFDPAGILNRGRLYADF